MLHGHHADIVYSYAGYDITSYFRSAFIEVRKTAENSASHVFRSNFSGMAFYLPHQLVSVVLKKHDTPLYTTDYGNASEMTCKKSCSQASCTDIIMSTPDS